MAVGAVFCWGEGFCSLEGVEVEMMLLHALARLMTDRNSFMASISVFSLCIRSVMYRQCTESSSVAMVRVSSSVIAV